MSAAAAVPGEAEDGADAEALLAAFDAGAVEPLETRACRIVEAQHRISTLPLVDSVEEHAQLEEMIERVKPPRPREPEFERLHYLLLTPFRYPPLLYGSRFGARFERGIWYGAERDRTALAEAAYYRLLFLAGSRADLGLVRTEHTLFRIGVATSRGVHLAAGRFAAHAATISSPSSHAATRRLGSAMRAAGVEAFTFRSARDPRGGTNVGVFTPKAFARKAPSPRSLATWTCEATRERVEFTRSAPLRPRVVAFPRETFLVGGDLPNPGAA